MALMVEANQMLEDVELWQLTFGISSQTSQNEDDLFQGPSFRQAWSETVRSGLIPGQAEFGQWSRHCEHVHAGDGRSEYSSASDLLRAQDWYCIDVWMHLRQPNDDENELWNLSLNSTVQTRFHGTNFAALIMIARTGGFIPGLNGHGLRGRYFQGCFTADTLGQALERCDSLRLRDYNGRLRACSMPIVLEMDAINVQRYHRHRRDLGVTSGVPGEVIAGVWIKKVHVNWRLVENFWEYIDGAINVPRGHWVDFTMCGNIRHCGSITRWTLEPWRDDWKRSNKGHWYCRRCQARCLDSSAWVLALA